VTTFHRSYMPVKENFTNTLGSGIMAAVLSIHAIFTLLISIVISAPVTGFLC
jgi:hypothetical protein